MNTPTPMPEAADELSVALLRRLADAPRASQRELARDTGVSLGKLNYAYLLTPSGIKAKARLTRDFLARKMGEYDRLRAEIEDLRAEVGDGR